MIDIYSRKNKYYDNLNKKLEELNLIDEHGSFAPVTLADSPNKEGCPVIISICADKLLISFLDLKGNVGKVLYELDICTIRDLSYFSHKPFSYMSFWIEDKYFSFFGYKKNFINRVEEMSPNCSNSNSRKKQLKEMHKCYGWSIKEFIAFSGSILIMFLMSYFLK